MIAETISVDKWGYLVGVGALFVAWLGLYLARRDLHRRMLTMSCLLIPLAPLGQYFYLQDYWHPPIILPLVIAGRTFGGLADLLFAFVMGGLATAVYPVIARRYPVADIHAPRRWVAVAFVVIEATSVLVLTSLLHVNSIFSSTLGFVLVAAVVVLIRQDLWIATLISAAMSGLALAGAEGILSFVVPLYLSRYWLLFHTPFGILIFGRVPLTEAMWGAAFGLVTGVLYDAFEGLTLVPLRASKRFRPHPILPGVVTSSKSSSVGSAADD